MPAIACAPAASAAPAATPVGCSAADLALTDTTVFANRSFEIDGVSPHPVPGGGLLNLGAATLTGGQLIGNYPDDCAGSGTTTAC
jgi:hypothetical protein